MKQFFLTVVFVIIALAIWFFYQNNTKVNTPTSLSPPPVIAKKIALIAEIPTEIKGFSFVLGGKCTIDTVNNKPQQGEVISVNRADGMAVDGWAFDDQKGSVPSVVVLQLASDKARYHAVLGRHGGREDLTKTFGKAEYSTAGYEGQIEIAALPAGMYEIAVIQKTDNQNLVCPTYRKLVINN